MIRRVAIYSPIKVAIERQEWTEDCKDPEAILLLFTTYDYYSSPKVLIAGGCNATTIFKDTEVLDITNGKTIKLPDLPRGKLNVTGGMLGGIPLICGGYDGQYQNECHQMAKDNISTFNSHLKSKRFSAVTTTKGPSLWVTGGFNSSDGALKSTEVIQRDGTIVAGPDLPVALQCHTITELKEDDQYMLIGGYSGQVQKSTYFLYNTSNGPWLEGPDLAQGSKMWPHSGPDL